MIKSRTIFTGDNLPILRGMDDESIDLIYLDPPFNSDHDYSAPIGSEAAGAEFKDTWGESDIKDEWWAEIADTNLGLFKLIDAIGELENRRKSSDKAYLIYMSMRLMEMRRILKPTGSLYLHCDPVMSHKLKIVLDSIFGRGNFVNEIVWQGAVGDTSDRNKKFIKSHEVVLFYRKSKVLWNDVWQDYSEASKKLYRKADKGGKYRAIPVDNPGGGGYVYDLGYGEKLPSRGYSMPKETALKWIESGELIIREGKVPSRKKYMGEGVRCKDVWTDIRATQSSEHTGYPTQKPLALLERVIKASSNEGDMVLDPFCGCATTCIASEKLGRDWIGVDISAKAKELIDQRMENDLGLFGIKIIHRRDVPRRDAPPPSKDIKKTLFGKQEGLCAGCRMLFPLKNLTLDHIIATSKGGPDTDSNLQLLCGNCNSIKGNRPMEYLKVRLKSLSAV